MRPRRPLDRYLGTASWYHPKHLNGCCLVAVDLAGKYLRDLQIGDDWAGIPTLLQRDMRGSMDGDDTSIDLEYRAGLGVGPAPALWGWPA